MATFNFSFAATFLPLFQLSNEISPIILENGIAQYFPGKVMPITALTEPAGGIGLRYDEFFAHYKSLPNGTLADWQIAEYPFASLVMAANAVVQMPLRVSLLMYCPAQNDSSRNYAAKAAILTALQNMIQNHVLLGGTFTVVTSSYTYSNCLLKQLRDVTAESDKQLQSVWQWDFEQPLVTASGAEQVLGAFLNKVELGLPTLPTWSL